MLYMQEKHHSNRYSIISYRVALVHYGYNHTDYLRKQFSRNVLKDHYNWPGYFERVGK